MKKLLAVLLAMAIIFSFAACGGGGNSDAEHALTVLTNIWDKYSDEEKFPAAGGDFSEENSVMDKPGKFGISDTEALDATLAFPAAEASKITDAASLMHMMNANTFTCGAFTVKDSGDVEAVANALKDNVMNRQWMCGFPEKLVIMEISGNVVCAFGYGEVIETFKTNAKEAYSSANVLVEESIIG